MHPTLIAMVAAEREADIARSSERRRHTGIASLGLPCRVAPLPSAPRRKGAVNALAATKTALARLVSPSIASQRGDTAGPEVCCT